MVGESRLPRLGAKIEETIHFHFEFLDGLIARIPSLFLTFLLLHFFKHILFQGGGGLQKFEPEYIEPEPSRIESDYFRAEPNARNHVQEKIRISSHYSTWAQIEMSKSNQSSALTRKQS